MKNKAREFAVKYHGDQMYGNHPYSVHLDDVAKIVHEYGEMATVIAYLHDVVEDTEASIENVKKEFGILVADSVEILTDEPGKNRKERKTKTYAKMALVSGKTEIALIVKAADRLANMRACVYNDNERLLGVYKSEHLVFKESVYRQGICDELWNELEIINNA